MEAIEPVNCALKPEFATRDLEFLNQVGGTGEQHPPAVFDQRQADGGRNAASSGRKKWQNQSPMIFGRSTTACGRSGRNNRCRLLAINVLYARIAAGYTVDANLLFAFATVATTDTTVLRPTA
jgi:hypothetical protein